MSHDPVLKRTFYVERLNKGRQRLEPGSLHGRIPRITRLMALAIRFDRLLREGRVGSQAELARLGHVSRARLTQIMNLVLLAPDIQEALLFLPQAAKPTPVLWLAQLQPIAAIPSWTKQRQAWSKLLLAARSPSSRGG